MHQLKLAEPRIPRHSIRHRSRHCSDVSTGTLNCVSSMLAILLCCALFAPMSLAEPPVETDARTSQALWVSNTGLPSVSELSQRSRSGIPRAVLNSGVLPAESPGKTSFDRDANLWIPLCGSYNIPAGLVIAIKASTLNQIATKAVKQAPVAAALFDSSFACPRATAFDGSGNLWISTSGSPFRTPPVAPTIVEYFAAETLSRYSRPGSEITSQLFGDLRGMIFDQAGDLWVADSDSGVDEFSPEQLLEGGSQTPHLALGSDFANPADLAFDSGGNLWVAYMHGPANPNTGVRSPGAVREYSREALSSSGSISPGALITIGGPQPCSPLDVCFPQGLAFDSMGDLWVSSNQIFEYSPQELGRSGTPLAQTTIATNAYGSNGKGIPAARWNFFSPGFITFGPVVTP